MYNPETKQVVSTRDVKWLTWTQKSPKDGISIFDKEEDLKFAPMGFDDNAVDFSIKPTKDNQPVIKKKDPKEPQPVPSTTPTLILRPTIAHISKPHLRVCPGESQGRSWGLP